MYPQIRGTLVLSRSSCPFESPHRTYGTYLTMPWLYWQCEFGSAPRVPAFWPNCWWFRRTRRILGRSNWSSQQKPDQNWSRYGISVLPEWIQDEGRRPWRWGLGWKSQCQQRDGRGWALVDRTQQCLQKHSKSFLCVSLTVEHTYVYLQWIRSPWFPLLSQLHRTSYKPRSRILPP